MIWRAVRKGLYRGFRVFVFEDLDSSDLEKEIYGDGQERVNVYRNIICTSAASSESLGMDYNKVIHINPPWCTVPNMSVPSHTSPVSNVFPLLATSLYRWYEVLMWICTYWTTITLRANFKLYPATESYFPVLYLKVVHHPLDLSNCNGGSNPGLLQYCRGTQYSWIGVQPQNVQKHNDKNVQLPNFLLQNVQKYKTSCFCKLKNVFKKPF